VGGHAVNRILLRVLLPLLIASAGWQVLHQFAAAQIARANPSPEALEEALRWNSDEPSYHFKLAIVLRDVSELRDLEKARHHLEQAVEFNPYNWRYRRELAQLYELSDLEQQAERAFLTAVSLNPNSGNYRWRLANFYLRHRSLDKAIPQLEVALATDSRLRRPALGLLLKAGGTYRQLDTIWPDDRSARLDLLRLLCQRKPRTGEPPALDYLRQLWSALLEDPEPLAIEDGTLFVERLLGEQLFHEARNRWIELARTGGVIDSAFESKSNSVWNGEFEAPLTQASLDWQPGVASGYTMGVVAAEGFEGSRALRLDFDGSQNLSLSTPGPKILVDPSQGYRLSFRARATDLSTDQGVYFEVLDGSSQEVLLRTEPVLGTLAWTRFESSFDVGSESHWINLRVRRNPSLRFDSLFRGILWLDSVEVTKR